MPWKISRVLLCMVFSTVMMVSCVHLATFAEANPIDTEVVISFDFLRQSTIASNQVALWVEDEEGHAVRTLLVTSFTAGRRGYQSRDMSLAQWVTAAHPENMTQQELDAISSATPSSGRLEYIWDMTYGQGMPVPDGIYRICLEGTLLWESAVLYTAEIRIDEASPGPLQVTTERNQPDNHDNEDMIQNVSMSVNEKRGVNP